MNSYEHVWAAVFGQPWAITPEAGRVVAEIVLRRVRGERLDADEIRAEIEAAGPLRQASGGRSGSVAVLDLFGVLAQRVAPMEAMSGATSTESFGQAFKAALADPSVSSLILNIDSPGGSVFGTGELADVIYQARGDKPIVAVANSLAASAAYWIGSAADEMVVTPGGEVGSIGVIAMHEDVSRMADAMGVTHTLITAGKFKGEGSPYAPLDQEARDALQSRVNDYYSAFVGAVARQRGTTASAVRDGYGQGRVVGAKEAVKVGLADRIDTLDGTIARLASGGFRRPRRGQAAAAVLENPPVAWQTVTTTSTAGHVLPAFDADAERVDEPEEDSAPNTDATDETERRRRRMRLASTGAGLLT
jgi:capsid assembly protease